MKKKYITCKNLEEDVSPLFSTLLLIIICYILIGDKMKKIIKGIITPTIIAILLGYILGTYVYKTYSDNLYVNLTSSKLYLLENGEYDTIESMRQENDTNNYLYYKDHNKYKSVVGITKNYDNIKKIEKLYNYNTIVLEYYIDNDIIDNRQDEYEKIIDSTSDELKLKEAVNNILNLYRNENKIHLIAIN